MTPTTLLALDPGLGQRQSGYGTGLVVLEYDRSWRCLHSELISHRTDRETDDEIAWSTACWVRGVADSWPIKLGVIEGVEFQGAPRAQQTIRLALLVGELRHALTVALCDRSRVVVPTRTQVLHHLGTPKAAQANLYVRRLVPGVGSTEHEAAAAAAGIVGFQCWRQAQMNAKGRRTV